MFIEELRAECENWRKTRLQREQVLKSLIGVEVQGIAILHEVTADEIRVFTVHNLYTKEWWNWDANQYRGLTVINYQADTFGWQLKDYNIGDGIKLTVRLREVSWHVKFERETPTPSFDLVSIERLNSADERKKRAEAGSGGCFVATAAYGYANSHVIILQAYRDRILSKTPVGRVAIRFYYVVSPTIARFIQASDRRRLTVRVLLTPCVLLARQQLEKDSIRRDI